MSEFFDSTLMTLNEVPVLKLYLIEVSPQGLFFEIERGILKIDVDLNDLVQEGIKLRISFYCCGPHNEEINIPVGR